MSYLIRGLAADGGVRVVAADTTELVRGAVARHGATPTAGAALGRTLTAGLLLSHVLLKDHRDRVTIRIRGEGPLGGVIADAGLDGSVRGYVQNPDVDLPLRDDGKLDVGAAVGKGEILVIRSHAPYGDPYSSSIDLVSGEIAEDVATFLARSEQIASAVLLGVYYGADGEVEQAGGVILQALPGADEAALAVLEANVRDFGALTNGMRRAPLLQLVEEELTWGLGFENLTDEPLSVRFACRCSDEKALEALAYFTPEERADMIAEDGGAEVVCHWCGEKRWVEPDAIRSLTAGEVRCPDCGTLWYRDGQTRIMREGELCSCGRPVDLPN
ncbi:MAG: Hsp33 family molecular chaperone HslO [Deinococcales bacterium]|nr:Hsp33 family molecular chaperone HslO [Deinococcales bacterium]